MTYRDEVCEAHAAGFTYLDFITASDHRTHRRVAALLVNPANAEQRLVTEDLTDDICASVSDLYEGATWHERETAELFGITFIGLADTRPLLTRPAMPAYPLRKSH